MRTENFFKVCCAAGLLAAMICTPGVGALEAESFVPPPPPVNPANPAQAGTAAEKSAVTNTLDDNYVFDDNGRRDPFTFTKAVVNLQENTDGKVVDTDNADHGIPKEVVEKKRNASELALNLAEGALMDLDPNSAIAKCEQGMEEFKDVPDISRYPELEVVKGRILRARKAGEQMRSRQTVERDFYAMNIKINGVMVHKKNPLAIINTKIVHKGDLVPVSGDATDIMVDEILSERVVFLFRGYRMTLMVADAGGK